MKRLFIGMGIMLALALLIIFITKPDEMEMRAKMLPQMETLKYMTEKSESEKWAELEKMDKNTPTPPPVSIAAIANNITIIDKVFYKVAYIGPMRLGYGFMGRYHESVEDIR